MNDRPTREERESWIAGGRSSALADDDRAELALLADLLAHPSTWAEPNAGLEDSVVHAVLDAAPASSVSAAMPRLTTSSASISMTNWVAES